VLASLPAWNWARQRVGRSDIAHTRVLARTRSARSTSCGTWIARCAQAGASSWLMTTIYSLMQVEGSIESASRALAMPITSPIWNVPQPLKERTQRCAGCWQRHRFATSPAVGGPAAGSAPKRGHCNYQHSALKNLGQNRNPLQIDRSSPSVPSAFSHIVQAPGA
jgi:hypothetical protein